MIRRMALVLTLTLIAAAAGADQGLIPFTADHGAEQEGTTILRGAHTLTVYQRPGDEPPRITIEARRIGSYEDSVVASWPAGAEEPRGSISVAPRRSGELVLTDCPPGAVQVRVDTGMNAAAISSSAPMAISAAADSPDGPAHFILSVGRLFIFVPPGTERFSVHTRGQGTEENVLLTAFTPDGEEVGSTTAIGSTSAELRVEVPPQHAGAVWSLTATEADIGVFEDCFIWLGRDLPQYVSLRPDGMLVPFVTGLTQPPRYVGAEERPTVRLQLARPIEDGTLSARVDGGPREPITVAAADGSIEVPVTDAAEAVTIELASPELPQTLGATTPLSLRGSMLFVGGYQPLIDAEPITAADGPQIGARISQALHDPPAGMRLEAALRRSEPSQAPGGVTAQVVQVEAVDDWDGMPVDLLPASAPGDGAWEWLVALRDETGAVLDWTRTGFVIWDEILFVDQTAAPSQTQPAHATGPWISFAPDGADAIPYRHRPSDDDVGRVIDLFATPGQFQPATIGVLALEDTRGLRVEAPELRTAAGESIPAEAWEVRWARYWPQRTGWTARAFEVIPEMLERRDAVDLAALEPAQAWLTVRVPEDTPPGRYQGAIRITDDAGRTETRRVRLEVLPFELMEPAEYHWGLYTDSVRWRNMPERQVRAEMRDFVAHGITSAMMYPPYHSDFSIEDDEISIDSSEFERFMRWALEEGLRPPTVMSMQALAGQVRQLLPDAEMRGPEFERVYKQIVQYFVELGEREGWGELVWHAVDEPNRRYEDKIEAAYTELSWFKDLGLTTFTTVNDPMIAQERLNPVLDVRCYYARFVGRSAEAQSEMYTQTTESGDRLWLYGTGCYIGMDGTTMPNRFLAGYMLRKTEAEGIWCWTLQRAKGDIFNDFDGEGMRESKEACTTYPSEDGTEMVPTLQWEGHRDGVDDFRYVYTLERLAADRGERGQQALADLERLLDQVPWGLRPGDFSAADSDALREEVAGLIRGLTE